MKKILILILTLFISSVANADVIGQSLSKASEKISEYTIGLIPGEGVTVGDNFELLAKKIAPIDLLSIDKAIKAITKNGGVSKILKNFK